MADFSGSIHSPRTGEVTHQLRHKPEVVNLKGISSQLNNITALVSLFQLLLILFNSFICFGLTYKIIILYMTVIQFLHLIKISIYNQSVEPNCGCWLRITWGMQTLIYNCCMIYFADHSDFPLIYIILVQVIFTFTWWIYQLHQSLKHLQSYNHLELAYVSFRLLYSLQWLMIVLKLQFIVTWSWLYVNSINLATIGILALLQICFIIDLILKSAHFMSETDPEIKFSLRAVVIGSLWVNLTFLSFCTLPGISLLSACLKLDSLNSLCITLSIIYILIYVAYTLYQKRQLICFIMTLVDVPQFQDSLPHPTSPVNQLKSTNNYTQEVPSKSQQLQKLPAVLMRLSSTYFMPAVTDEKDKIHKTEIYKEYKRKKTTTEVMQNEDQEAKLCFNCCQREGETVYLPCGHGGQCIQCALEWFKEKTDCAICRQQVDQIVQVRAKSSTKFDIIDIIAMKS